MIWIGLKEDKICEVFFFRSKYVLLNEFYSTALLRAVLREIPYNLWDMNGPERPNKTLKTWNVRIFRNLSEFRFKIKDPVRSSEKFQPKLNSGSFEFGHFELGSQNENTNSNYHYIMNLVIWKFGPLGKLSVSLPVENHLKDLKLKTHRDVMGFKNNYSKRGEKSLIQLSLSVRWLGSPKIPFLMLPQIV